ncbi:MAG: alanine--tRNA ligase [Desulfoprunum sp.]|uniref:alanine--tRNA ligase n=1 Tax=Desulfoprunum sp. TaxID=2020866 RepID=UPI003C76FAFE
MKGSEIRSKFLRFFEGKGHTVVDSSPLIPKDDPTLLFTNAGMVQFKMVFMGEDKRPYTKAVTSQRCVRAGGKHNDLENVGYTARHHTFFEMLGNFSFGDYFKDDAIRYAWQFLTRELGLPPEKLWVSVFEDDDEAFGLWEKVEDLPKGRIVRMGEKDNFWAMGDTGPCGPCSEIHIDQGVEAGCGRSDCALGCDCDRFLELWNLVFMQFNRAEDGTMTPLPKPSIDTGMGLERVAAVLQGKLSNYDSDLFAPIIEKLEQLSGKRYKENSSDDTAMRVIADHARATAFLVADGVLPSNEGRGYVLRRIMRRAVRYGRNLGLTENFLEQVVVTVVAAMEGAYPVLQGATSLLGKVVPNEEERFRETLEHGLQLLEEEIAKLETAGSQTLPGSFVFKLYDTYGFPYDIVRDIANERRLVIDEAGYREAMTGQRLKSRSSRKDEGLRLREDGVKTLLEAGIATEFVGYDCLEIESAIKGLIDGEGESVGKLSAGDSGKVIVATTPFYAESGGQVGDSGVIRWQNGKAEVNTTSLEGEAVVLHDAVIVQGELAVGQKVTLTVASGGRKEVAAHHSATHLLHAALTQVLGDHIKQAGSLVGPGRLRFDFTHFSPLSQEEIERVEDIVNGQIRADFPVQTRILAKEEAIRAGARALFGEKYADDVRVVNIGEVSTELCGGTHAGSSGEIGLFKILSESGIAAGIRRIEAVAGRTAFEYVRKVCRRDTEIGRLLNAREDEVPAKIMTLLHTQKQLEKQIADLSTRLASTRLDGMLDKTIDVAGVKVLAVELSLDSARTLREIGDKVRDLLPSGVAVLGGVIEGKAAILALVSNDLTGRIQAGDLARQVAVIVGGKGGGRPDMAQAGGPLTDKIGEAIASVPMVVGAILKN